MDIKRMVTEAYDSQAEEYTRLYFNQTEEDIPNIDHFISYLVPGGSILDAGCSSGGLVNYLNGKGFKASGIDISPKMISIAKQKVSQSDFWVMDMAKLDFEDESFDGIMAMHSLIHISSEEMPMVLTEFKRVLKSEGKILILAEEGEADKIISESINCNSKMFLNLFTQERLVNFVEQAGFEILEQYITTLININDLPGRGIYIIARKP